MIMYQKKDLYRCLAVVIDSFFVSFIYNNLLGSGFEVVNFNLLLLVFLGYYVLFDLFNNGLSIGKIILGISVSKNSTLRSRLSHTFLKTVSIFITPVTVVVYLITGEILHDYLEKTVEVVE